MKTVFKFFLALSFGLVSSMAYAKNEPYGSNYNNWSFTKGDGLCRAIYNWQGSDWGFGIDMNGVEYVSIPNTKIPAQTGMTGTLEFEGKFPAAAVKAESKGGRLFLRDFTGAEWGKFRAYSGYSYNVNGVKGKFWFADINPAMDRLTKCYNEIKVTTPPPPPPITPVQNYDFVKPFGQWKITHWTEKGMWLCRAAYTDNNKTWTFGRKANNETWISVPQAIPKGSSQSSALMTTEYALGGGAYSTGTGIVFTIEFESGFLNSMIKYGGYDWWWENGAYKGSPRFKDFKPAMESLNKCYRDHGGKF